MSENAKNIQRNIVVGVLSAFMVVGSLLVAYYTVRFVRRAQSSSLSPTDAAEPTNTLAAKPTNTLSVTRAQVTPTSTPDRTLASGAQGPWTGTVTTDASLREGPGTEYRQLGVLKEGETILIQGRTEDSEWFFGSTEAFESAWIAAAYVSIETDGATVPAVEPGLIPDTPVPPSTPGPEATNTPSPTYTPVSDATSTPSPTHTPVSDAIDTPVPTHTPEPTQPVGTPTPLATLHSPLPTPTPLATLHSPLPSPTPPEVMYTPLPTLPSGIEPACDCSGDLYECSDFATQKEAQSCYELCKSLGKGDIHRLDEDGNGQVCE